MVVTAEIIGEDQDDVEVRGVTFYRICVRDSGLQWDVKRRYSEFRRLDVRLRCSREFDLLRLPSKGLVGFRRWLNLCKFKEHRRVGLGVYLEHLTQQIECLANSSMLLEFFEGQSRVSANQAVRVPVGDQPVILTHLTLPLAALPAAHGANVPAGANVALLRPQLRCCPRDRRQRVQESKRSLDFLDGDEWLRFEAAQPLLAASIRRCSEVRVGSSFENDSEAAFCALRRRLHFALRSSRSNEIVGCSSGLCLEEVPGKELVWEFLLLMRVRRPFYRNQVDELIQILDASMPWAQVLNDDEDLRQLKEDCI